MDSFEEQKDISELIYTIYELLQQSEEYAEYCNRVGDYEKEINALKMQIDCLKKIVKWQGQLYENHIEMSRL